MLENQIILAQLYRFSSCTYTRSEMCRHRRDIACLKLTKLSLAYNPAKKSSLFAKRGGVEFGQKGFEAGVCTPP